MRIDERLRIRRHAVASARFAAKPLHGCDGNGYCHEICPYGGITRIKFTVEVC
jgi:ferredoxin